MVTVPRAGGERRSASFAVRAALVTLVAAGVLAMHALSAGLGAGHADPTHTAMPHPGMSDASTSSVVTLPVMATSSQPGQTGHHGHDGSTEMVCGVAAMCLALVAGGLLLLVAGRARRPLVARRRVLQSLSRLRLLALARMPDPPDLHALSILRC